MAESQREVALQVILEFNTHTHTHFHFVFYSRSFLSISIIFRVNVCLLRWPRLPVEASSLLDFGAAPVNESKVGNICVVKIRVYFDLFFLI